MSRNRVRIEDRLREFGKNKFKVNGEFLFCVICDTAVDYKRKGKIVAHLKSKTHVDKEYGRSHETYAKGMNQCSEDVGIASFACDLIEAFKAANIPVEKVNHPSFISLFNKYLGMETADVFPLNHVEELDICSKKQSKIQQSASKSAEKIVSNENVGNKASCKQFNVSSLNSVFPRKDFIPWSDYFMSVAFLSAMRSKDPNSQVGACIVNEENKIVGTGYNGMPLGCSDHDLPWAREADNVLDTKYPYVCHAEMNAICNKNCADVKGCAMYVALFPCNECAKLIIQSGIKEVIYMCDKYHDTPYMTASRHLLDLAGVKYRQHIPKSSKILIDFDSIKSSSVS